MPALTLQKESGLHFWRPLDCFSNLCRCRRFLFLLRSAFDVAGVFPAMPESCVSARQNDQSEGRCRARPVNVAAFGFAFYDFCQVGDGMAVKLVVAENIDHGRIGEVALGPGQPRLALMNV